MKKIIRASSRVDDFLLKFIRQDEQIPNLHEGMIYALGLHTSDPALRGKRLRPSLGLLVCEALGGDPNLILPFSAAIEIFHNFTLVHDDIEDGDEFRRNQPCVYKKYGLAHGINIGDFMLVKVYRALMHKNSANISPKIRLKLFEVMSDTLEHTHIGQALDINARENKNFTIDEYFRLVTEKTGYCLAASMAAAAIVTKSSPAIIRSLTDYAKAIGPLFQIRDDMIDLTEGKGRKTIGSDIREGKRSYLVAHVTEKCAAKEKEKLYRILDAPRHKTSDLQVEWVCSLFRKYKSFEAGMKENNRLMQSAMKAIEKTPVRLRKLLTGFAEMLLSRIK
ncbi:polyprenyl synthetase family protein [Candidatus Sumerlaeota bacterium]|nr:polyprenyl synthetase family protein [Candidatus Sumerlaeota bacterium]